MADQSGKIDTVQGPPPITDAEVQQRLIEELRDKLGCAAAKQAKMMRYIYNLRRLLDDHGITHD